MCDRSHPDKQPMPCYTTTKFVENPLAENFKMFFQRQNRKRFALENAAGDRHDFAGEIF